MRPAVLPSPSSLAPTVQSPPKIPISKQLFPKLQRNQHQPQPSPFRIKISRRDAALLSFFALVPPPPATAFTIGISGPKDWLREQKKKASKFLFAPIDASRESLRTAYRLLTPSGSDDSNRDMGEVLRLLRSAARDCVMQERNLFVAFQASTGVEVCTFRLIVKNASSLLANNDPAKLEAEAMLDDLIFNHP
ncbi:uncharacterized protein LOC131163021 isoform X2 [Malania oleifera]|uniref:uncharacterized protein LOC131163021 isoform X2 n=1 Tax=Malania oleifera TaxID=397392 RepID=UPI0025ADE0F5|nr:uncharacterized protein LOC131163021 isoform X2 [Malania oleifera]